jgi:hypothetical protein
MVRLDRPRGSGPDPVREDALEDSATGGAGAVRRRGRRPATGSSTGGGRGPDNHTTWWGLGVAPGSRQRRSGTRFGGREDDDWRCWRRSGTAGSWWPQQAGTGAGRECQPEQEGSRRWRVRLGHGEERIESEGEKNEWFFSLGGGISM